MTCLGATLHFSQAASSRRILLKGLNIVANDIFVFVLTQEVRLNNVNIMLMSFKSLILKVNNICLSQVTPTENYLQLCSSMELFSLDY